MNQCINQQAYNPREKSHKPATAHFRTVFYYCYPKTNRKLCVNLFKFQSKYSVKSYIYNIILNKFNFHASTQLVITFGHGSLYRSTVYNPLYTQLLELTMKCISYYKIENSSERIMRRQLLCNKLELRV